MLKDWRWAQRNATRGTDAGREWVGGEGVELEEVCLLLVPMVMCAMPSATQAADGLGAGAWWRWRCEIWQ
jgi:hypothetical protein